METTVGFRVYGLPSVSWNEAMEKTMDSTILGYMRATLGIHSFIPSQAQLSTGKQGSKYPNKKA